MMGGRSSASTARAILALIVIACLVLVGAAHYRHHSPPIPVFDVEPSDFIDSVQFRGEVSALKSLSISAPAEVGELRILKLTPDGTLVKPGDPVVEFDQTKTQQDLAQYRSSLRYARADIAQARAQTALTEEQDVTAVSKAGYDLATAKLDASKEEIVSKIEGAEARLKVADAEQKLREAKQKLASDHATSEASIKGKTQLAQKAAFDVQRAELALSELVLRSPSEGTISLLSVWHAEGFFPFKTGDRAWPGAPIAELPESSSLRITARVDETERGRLSVGQRVSAHLEAIPDRQFTGKIEEISTIASEDYSAGWPFPRNFRLRVALDQTDSRLKPGMTTQITAIVDQISKAMVIPVQASFQREGETVAYVWDGRHFRSRSIEVSKRSGDRLLVARGLKMDDRIALQDPKESENR
jgi:HlyD family secretion protein